MCAWQRKTLARLGIRGLVLGVATMEIVEDSALVCG